MLSLFSCGKENSNPEVPNSNKVKTYTEKYTSDGGSISFVFNLNYDSKGRIISMVSANSPGDQFVYNYLSDNKLTMEIQSSQNGLIHEDIFLTNGSWVDSTFQYNDTEDYTTEKYFYNSNNQLIKIRSNDYSGTGPSSGPAYTLLTYNSNGDVEKIENDDGSTETFEYYTDLKGPLPVIMPYLSTPEQINLIKKHNIYYGSSLESTSDVTYTFDSKSRITSVIETYDTGEIITKSFTY